MTGLPGNNRQKVLITGASGFLGSHLADRLKHDYSVRSLDIKPAAGCDEDMVGSVADAATVKRAMQGVNALVIAHMAPNRPEIYATPDIPFDVNVKGTALLFHSALEQGIRRVVLISSIAVVAGRNPDGAPLSQDLPASPVIPYGLTKALQESIAEYYHRNHGFEIAILRPAYIVREDSLKDKYGNQRPTVNWQFIDPRDIAEATAAALSLPGLSYEVFYTVAGPDADKVCDLSLIRTRLGWNPKYTFAQYPRDA